MAEFDLNKSTTTNFTSNVPDFIVQSKALDVDSDSGETYYYFGEANTNLGYACAIPEIYSACAALCTWAFGKGWETDARTKVEFEHFTGRGNDTFGTIMWNHEFIKLVVGDAFAEIVRKEGNEETIVNLVPISPERVRIVSKNGRIKRYEVWDGGDWETIEIEDMYHSSNKRIGDQIHGTSQIDAIRNIIDARNEAIEDERTIKHRDKALGIVYYKTNNAGKISYANTQIENAVKNGEMVGMPEDTGEIKPYPSKSSEDRQSWIQYLENFTYQSFGVPRSIATSDGTSEVGGKMGHVIFEPIYTKEQEDEEKNIWNRLHRKVTFNRPPSLGGMQPELDESKNTGQLAIQPNDVEASVTRE